MLGRMMMPGCCDWAWLCRCTALPVTHEWSQAAVRLYKRARVGQDLVGVPWWYGCLSGAK
jgi:hypothetical protein